MTQETKHAQGPYRLIRYTDVNESRVTRAFSAEEYDTLDDPSDFMNPVILCEDLPPEYAAAPKLLKFIEKILYSSRTDGAGTIGHTSMCRSHELEAQHIIAKAKGQS